MTKGRSAHTSAAVTKGGKEPPVIRASPALGVAAVSLGLYCFDLGIKSVAA
jgi:hypothetical protein